MGLIDAAAGTSKPVQHIADHDESAPGSAFMSDADDNEDDEDDGDIPTVTVGEEEFTVTDVNESIIARMTQAEKDIYTQKFQDFYSHMYE
jgi:spermidine/putrescine-binding protein